jgi:hypothetical protein
VTLAELLAGTGTTAEQAAAHLDALPAGDRVAQVVELSRSHQQRLWQLASAAPGKSGELDGDYAGRNSLQLLSHFHKRFGSSGGGIVGHNRHPLMWLIGPGYFSVEAGAPGLLRFDYARLPAAPPPGWPPVASNTGLFARAVYGGLVDEVAWVTRDVLVGAAYRSGRPLDSYFVLAREERAAR